MHNEQTIDGRARRFRVGAFIGGRRLPLFFSSFSPDLTNLVTMADFPHFDRARRGSCIWETVRPTFSSLKPIVEQKGVDRWAPESKSIFCSFFRPAKKSVLLCLVVANAFVACLAKWCSKWISFSPCAAGCLLLLSMRQTFSPSRFAIDACWQTLSRSPPPPPAGTHAVGWHTFTHNVFPSFTPQKNRTKTKADPSYPEAPF